MVKSIKENEKKNTIIYQDIAERDEDGEGSVSSPRKEESL